MVKFTLPRGFTWKHMAAAGAFAICSSFYINQPMIEEMQRKQRQKEQEEAMKVINEAYADREEI